MLFGRRMELDIRLLRTFRTVADTRSFTGAARRLRLTQSTVSQQVMALEKELGAQLLKRSNRFVGLTTAGEIVLQCTRQVLENLDRVRAMLAERTDIVRGHLSVGAPALFCHSLLPSVLGDFHARYPGIALSVITADPDSMAARLAHRELDLALLPFPVRQQSLGTVQIGRDELVVIAPPGNSIAAGPRIDARSLKGQPVIVPNPGNKLWAAWDAFLMEAGVFPEIVVETDDLDLAKALAIQGHGLTVVPRWAAAREVAEGTLRAVALGRGGVFREWCLAYHHGTQLTGIRRNFLRICNDEMPRLLGSGRGQLPLQPEEGPSLLAPVEN
jgi:DNA-binding transcriptional LysR family regulator